MNFSFGMAIAKQIYPTMENNNSSTIDSARNGITSEIQNQVGAVAAQAKERLGKVCDQAEDKARRTARSVVSFTKEKPLAALGIAIGAGLLLGALLKSRK